MSLKQKAIEYYDKKYKKLLIIPILLLILAIAQISIQAATTGDFVNKGTSLKGGSTVSVLQQADQNTLQSQLNQQFPDLDITVRELADGAEAVGISIESTAQSDEDIVPLVAAIQSATGATQRDITIEVTGASLGGSFFRQTFVAMIMAFVLMAIVVFFYFRLFIPSVAVVAAALSDLIITLAIFNLTGMKLSTAGIAAFLMLIGYSVDTDILLTTRVLKRRDGSVMERILGAMKTGMTMTITTLVAVTTGLIITNSPVVQQIMVILLIGLLVDVINTWIQNVGIIRLYLERKNKSIIH
jgi:preprotein translocase subunit SecF